MNTGFYASLAGLVARTQGFDMAAHNLANVSSPGYRAQREFYQTIQAGVLGGPDGGAPGSLNSFGVVGGAYLDKRPGSIEETGGPYDLALEGQGYFAVETPSGVRYSRNGQFHVNSENQLVDSSGALVQGDQGAIELPPGPLSISDSGMLSVRGAIVGQLRLVEFSDGVELRAEGNSYFAPASAMDAGAAQPASETRVRQGALEASNMNPIDGAVSLMTLQRQTEMLQRTLMIFHSEFNRTAVEELPKAF